MADDLSGFVGLGGPPIRWSAAHPSHDESMRCEAHLNGALTIGQSIQQELHGMFRERMPVKGNRRDSYSVDRGLYVVPEGHKLDVVRNR